MIGTNQQGELGLSKEDEGMGDREPRKTFCVQEALREKPVEMVAIGKAGYVLAIGKVVEQEGVQVDNSHIKVEDSRKGEEV